MSQPLFSSGDKQPKQPKQPPETREEYSIDYGIGSGYQGGNILGQNTLGVTGVPTFQYATNIIGDPWPITSTVINEYTALTIPAFWSGVRFLSETLAGLPLDVIKKAKDGSKQIDTSHPVSELWNCEINDLTTPYVLKETLYQHAIVWGNGYAYIDRDSSGNVIGIYTVLPDRVIPFRIEDPATGRVKQWYALAINGRVTPMPIAAADMIHIPGLGFDGMRGYPLVQLMAQTLRVGKSAEAFGDRFFSNGGHLGGVIESENKLTPEQIETLRSQISTGYTGIANSNRWMVLMAGAKARTLTLPPDSAQYLETRRFSVTDVARILRVPPHVLYDLDRATWANLEQMGIDLVKYSLSAWLIKSEQEITRKLLSSSERKAGFFSRLDVTSLMRGDHMQQIDAASKRLASGITTINEERAKLELNNIGPDGDTHYVPAQWMPAEEPGEETEPPQTPDQEEKEEAQEANSSQNAAPEPPEPPIEPQTIQDAAKPPLVAFSALVVDVAARVGGKTLKATKTALKRAEKEPNGWVPWANVFANEQENYAIEAVEPILETIRATGYELTASATSIGTAYAKKLRQHFAKLHHNEPSEAPDLSAIIDKAIGSNGGNSNE